MIERNRFEKCTKSSSHHNNHHDSCRILGDEVGFEDHCVLHVVGMKKKFVVPLQNYFLKNRTSSADYSLLLLEEEMMLPPAVVLKSKQEAPMMMMMVITVLPISIVLIACS